MGIKHYETDFARIVNLSPGVHPNLGIWCECGVISTPPCGYLRVVEDLIIECSCGMVYKFWWENWAKEYGIREVGKRWKPTRFSLLEVE